MFNQIAVKLLALVVIIAFLECGRHERRVALAMAVQAVIYVVIDVMPGEGLGPGLVMLAGQFALLVTLGWLAVRTPSRWLFALIAFQGGQTLCWLCYCFDIGFYLRNLMLPEFGFAMLKASWFAMVVARRLLGPPHALPDPSRPPEPDLGREAAAPRP